MSDLGDLDGDGIFDAIDITIMEDGENNARNGSGGCCLVFFFLGSLFAAGLVVVDFWLEIVMDLFEKSIYT